jgi:two-component system cell cycle response regulator
MANQRLLIIEDDTDQRELIRETLDDYFARGTCHGVGSLQEALKQDLASFDLILSDYNLPDSSSMQLVEEIRARCQTPVILVTGENACHLAAEAIRRGASDYIVKMGDYLFTIPLVVEKNLAVAKIKRENEELRMEIELALAQVREKNAQLEQSLKKVEEMAATDALTGLYNRRHFGKALEHSFAEAERYTKDLSCLMIDLDCYKKLNDTYGHQVGDQLLILAGRVITANKRTMDIAARYGGDEFVLLLPHASAEEAAAVAGRISEEFFRSSASLLKREPTDGVTMSIGIGSLKANKPVHADQLLTFADAALYSSKDAGRNRISVSNDTRNAA